MLVVAGAVRLVSGLRSRDGLEVEGPPAGFSLVKCCLCATAANAVAEWPHLYILALIHLFVVDVGLCACLHGHILPEWRGGNGCVYAPRHQLDIYGLFVCVFLRCVIGRNQELKLSGNRVDILKAIQMVFSNPDSHLLLLRLHFCTFYFN